MFSFILKYILNVVQKAMLVSIYIAYKESYFSIPSFHQGTDSEVASGGNPYSAHECVNQLDNLGGDRQSKNH